MFMDCLGNGGRGGVTVDGEMGEGRGSAVEDRWLVQGVASSGCAFIICLLESRILPTLSI